MPSDPNVTQPQREPGVRGSTTDEIAKLKEWAEHCTILSDDRGYHSGTILTLIQRLDDLLPAPQSQAVQEAAWEAVCDKIAENAPPAARVDIDELQRLYDASTPGEWFQSGCAVFVRLGDEELGICGCGAGEIEGKRTIDNAVQIAAAHNVMPQLLAEVREGRERDEKRNEELKELYKLTKASGKQAVNIVEHLEQQLAASQQRERKLREMLKGCDYPHQYRRDLQTIKKVLTYLTHNPQSRN